MAAAFFAAWRPAAIGLHTRHAGYLGNVRLRWDFPVTVRPGEVTRVELSNLNAAKPFSAAQNSDTKGSFFTASPARCEQA